MRVLVAVASKYGATDEIAGAIGRELVRRGLETEVRRIDDVVDVTPYRAFVVGSAVYAGHWLGSARDFVEERAAELASRPTWLFSSGPIGDPPRPSEGEAVHVEPLIIATRANEHRVFAGKLDKRRLSFPERAVVFAFRAAEGDFRDWDAIDAWAGEIADALGTTGAGSAGE
jgi:menaquinone-dependent protoporphyrinogen oxidase